MTFDEVKAQGAKVLGTPSYIPKEDWEEFSLEMLHRIKADLSSCLERASNKAERKYMLYRDRSLSKVIDLAEKGERVFATQIDDDGKDFLFATTQYHRPKRRFLFFGSN